MQEGIFTIRNQMDKGFISKTSANSFRNKDVSRTFVNVFDTSLIPKNIEYAMDDKRVLSRKSLLYSFTSSVSSPKSNNHTRQSMPDISNVRKS